MFREGRIEKYKLNSRFLVLSVHFYPFCEKGFSFHFFFQLSVWTIDANLSSMYGILCEFHDEYEIVNKETCFFHELNSKIFIRLKYKIIREYICKLFYTVNITLVTLTHSLH